ncbi:MAG TPA: signal recognition particle-docking protein FtsY [Candidatus Eisenbacteria bacterium]|nr:signal recognition particle-docking protein FtsY [Candidatus Eisenbacteria bacterium]
MDVVVIGAAAAAVAAGLLVWGFRRARRQGVGAEAPPLEVMSAPERPARGLRQALDGTRRKLREQLDAALGRRGSADSVYEALEEALIGADVGARTTASLLARLRSRLGKDAGGEGIRTELRADILEVVGGGGPVTPAARPWVILVTGVNGVGKTTTIGKLAAAHREAGRKVLIVAADTFRAAAIDQLAVWAERSGADIVRHGPGADPSAVAYDGIRAARARGADVVLVDTAGRLHTRGTLMDELRKVRRTIERELPGAPQECLLVVDATTGQNALSQARAFVEAAGVTGVVVTKLDGTARGGIVVAIRAELGLPVRYVGVGEGVRDLREFDAHEFVAGLLGDDGDG